MFHILKSHWAHGSTTVVGVVMASANLSMMVSITGLVIGLGGLACSISREWGAWLDRKSRRGQDQ